MPGCPVEAAGAMKMWKTEKQVSHIFTAPWKTRSRKERGGEFPTAPTGPTAGLSFGGIWKANPRDPHGEYPIDVWHGDNQCRSV